MQDFSPTVMALMSSSSSSSPPPPLSPWKARLFGLLLCMQARSLHAQSFFGDGTDGTDGTDGSETTGTNDGTVDGSGDSYDFSGFGFGYGAIHGIGMPRKRAPIPHLPTGENPVADFIPVARITDMLLDPGGAFEFNGQRLKYPDARLMYWSGGNPFHKQQDINRLLRG